MRKTGFQFSSLQKSIFVWQLIVATVGAQKFIEVPSELNCDFDRPCKWRNGSNSGEDDFDWLIGDSVILDSWHSIPRGVNGPGDLFTYTRGAFGTKHRENRALLISDPIPCQVGNGLLKFFFWKTALPPSMRVCIRKPPGPHGKLNCLLTIHGMHRQEWIMKTVTIKAERDPFEIVFEARFKHHFDIIGLDKITYSARLCGTALLPTIITVSPTPVGPISPTVFTLPGTRGTVPPFETPGTAETSGTLNPTNTFFPTQPTGPVEPTQPTGPTSGNLIENGQCGAVDCSFDRGGLCAYAVTTQSPSELQLPVAGAFLPWKVSNKETSNSLTGIFSDVGGTGTYAYAGETTNRLDQFIMQSPRFSINGPSLIEFNYYQAGIEGRLRACVNGLLDCRFESLGKDIKSDARRWRTGAFQLEPGTYTLNFIADNLDKNYVIGMDNVQLKTVGGVLGVCAMHEKEVL